MNSRKGAMNSILARRDRIYLTGFMGCGKSTIGPILANSIGYEFLDLDRMIESASGMSVNAIFKEKGEAYFRSLERDLIAKISAFPTTVIALGGGTLVDPVNLQVITTTGILVYLKMTEEEIFKRLRNKTDRPMLAGEGGARLDEAAFRIRIKELLGRREPLYNHADISVLTDDRKVGVTVDLIVKKLSPYIG